MRSKVWNSDIKETMLLLVHMLSSGLGTAGKWSRLCWLLLGAAFLDTCGSWSTLVAQNI